jgi:putative oxidoreductase
MNTNIIQSLAWLGVRLAFGGMMLTHGIPKWGRLTGDEPIKFANFLGMGPEISLALAVFAELVCALLIMVGYRTRWASIPLMITMLVAAFYAHGDDPFSDKEPALLYFFGYLAIWTYDSGPYSLDAWIASRNKTT